jgi:hypothetical protein
MKYIVLMRRPNTPQARWRLANPVQPPFDTAEAAQVWIDQLVKRDDTWQFHITEVVE